MCWHCFENELADIWDRHLVFPSSSLGFLILGHLLSNPARKNAGLLPRFFDPRIPAFPLSRFCGFPIRIFLSASVILVSHRTFYFLLVTDVRLQNYGGVLSTGSISGITCLQLAGDVTESSMSRAVGLGLNWIFFKHLCLLQLVLYCVLCVRIAGQVGIMSVWGGRLKDCAHIFILFRECLKHHWALLLF